MISFKKVTYKINNQIILDSISFVIKNNEKVLIMGPSGSGKSTILNLISQNIKPTSGIIYYDKKDINSFNKKELNKYRKNDITTIFQKDDLFDNLTVYENLTLFYYSKDVTMYLKKANLWSIYDQKVATLSGGQRQRVAIIKACLTNCKVLLCDEITSALDYDNAQKIIDFVLKMFHDKTIIFISHDKKLFDNKIDHFFYLDKAKINEDTIINDINNKSKKITSKKAKSLLNVSFKQGFKKISFSTLILFLISILCFYINLFFNDIFYYFAFNSYSKYIDYDVVFIKDNESIQIDNVDVFYSYKSILESSNIYLNNKKITNIVFYPFNSKENNEKVIVNDKLLKILNIKQIDSLKIKNDKFNLTFKNLNVINDNNMFSTPCIYYDIKSFNELIDCQSDELILINYDFTKDDDRFTNNPLFEEKKEDKPYIDSKAYNDYLTFKIVFDSIKSIVSYYFITTFFYIIISSILTSFSKMLKDMKVIAIYIARGYSSFEIIFSYLIAPLLYLTITLSLLILDIKFFLPIILTFFLQISTTFFSYYLIKRKKLHELLKEDLLC